MDLITDNYAIYNGDCVELIQKFPKESIHLSVYSPPFASLYTYSSSDNDMGNNITYEEFLEHYEYLIKELYRVMLPGRLNCVHCMDLPIPTGGLRDFPGDIIRLYQKNGFYYFDRHSVWKEPLRVAIRTRARALMHQTLVKDSSKVRGALADYVLIFKKKGENKIPIEHKYGLTEYSGDIELHPEETKKEFLSYKDRYKNHTDQMTNKLSQWIWRRYASSFWTDIRQNRMIEYECAREEDDERHICPLPLDIIDRCIHLYSNPGETVLTPFMGVGSEVYGALSNDRKAVGFELKESYYLQAEKNIKSLEISKKLGTELELDFED
jgi:DNA modification methylase